MKILGWIVAFWFLFSVSSFSSIFEEANQLYKNKEYEKALEKYLLLEQQGNRTANIYYNIGNCYYRLNKLGYAILYYEKAYKLNPDDESIQKNLKIASSRTIDKIVPIQKIFFYQWIDSIVQNNSPAFFGYLSVVVIWISIGFAILFFITKKSNIRKLSFYSFIVFFVAFVIIIWFGYQSNNYHQNTPYGIVLAKTVYVKSSPDQASTDLFILHEGTKFEIQDNISNWYKIRLANGSTGWIEDSNIGKI